MNDIKLFADKDGKTSFRINTGEELDLVSLDLKYLIVKGFSIEIVVGADVDKVKAALKERTASDRRFLIVNYI